MIRKLALCFLTSVQLLTLNGSGIASFYSEPTDPFLFRSPLPLSLYRSEALSLPSATTLSPEVHPSPMVYVDQAVSKIETPSHPSDDEGTVHYQLDGNVATMTLDRPPVNAWSIAMFKRVTQVATEVYRRPDIHMVIVKAKGERFGVGGDIKAVAHALTKEDYGFFAVITAPCSKCLMRSNA